MLQNCDKKWRVAAPSCVWPETAAENCRRLARTLPEVGLYLLEGAACLAYGPKDLPQKTHGLRYHAHLPVDLPWEDGGQAAFAVVAGLLAKTAHLAPWGFVLHPPADRAVLAAFVAAWRAAGQAPADLLLENIETASPADGPGSGPGSGLFDLPGPRDTCWPWAMPCPRTRPPWPRPSACSTSTPPTARKARRRAAATSTAPSSSSRPRVGTGFLWMLGHLAPETVVLEVVFAPMHLVESLAVFEALADTIGAGS